MSTILWTLLSLFLGVFAFLFTLPIFPTAVRKLANEPNEFRQEDGSVQEVSEFGFFTGIEPKQVKIVEREGGGFSGCIMRFEGHNFLGNCNDNPSNSSKDWELVDTTKGIYAGKGDAHPIPPFVLLKKKYDKKQNALLLLTSPLRFPFWVWKRYVYALTGYVFTGIYPYRKVRTYQVERLTGNFEKKVDFSDHFRVGDFEFPVLVPEADTQDKVPVRVRLTVVARVYNPYEAAYGTDNWASRLRTAVEGAVNDFTKVRPLDEVLSSKDESTVNDLAKALMEIGDPTYGSKKVEQDEKIDDEVEQDEKIDDEVEHDTVVKFGIKIVQVLVADITAVMPTSEIGQKLSDVALARVDRDAKQIRAEGDAAQLQKQIEVVQKAGHVGLATLAAERDVRVATAAGERATVIIGGGGSTDAIQLAILQELKDKNLRDEILGKEKK